MTLSSWSPPASMQNELLLDDSVFSGLVGFNLTAWMPEFHKWNPVGQQVPTSCNGLQPISFETDTIELPTAVNRWKLSLAEHPEVTFADVRAGNWPERTETELQERHEAIELAREVRPNLDIRPLKTSTIIRQLRDGLGRLRD